MAKTKLNGVVSETTREEDAAIEETGATVEVTNTDDERTDGSENEDSSGEDISDSEMEEERADDGEKEEEADHGEKADKEASDGEIDKNKAHNGEEEASEEEEEDSEEEEDESDNEEEERVPDDEEEEKDGEEEEEEEEAGRGTNLDMSEVSTEAMLPLEMWFPNTEYGNNLKIGTKCYVAKAVSTLKSVLEPHELEWFTEHPQLCHFFHMPEEPNHKTMGMWMLLLRMVKTDNKKEAWFVVNGVPILYSLREHTLLSGMDGHEYPANFKTRGSMKFARKHFKGVKKITYKDVENKFKSMVEGDEDRLNIAVLYFLCSVIKGMAKNGEKAPEVERFFLKIAANLDWCKTFPWGRFSFDKTMLELQKMMKSFNGKVKPHWCIPSFIIPLEILAFEAIPALKQKFRMEEESAMDGCPRMCKSKFKNSSMKGFSLKEINRALGKVSEIESIVQPNEHEESLERRLLDPPEHSGHHDLIFDGWRTILEGGKKIWFEEYFNSGVEGRKEKEKASVAMSKRKGKELEFQNVVVEEMNQMKEMILGKISCLELAVVGRLEKLDSRMESLEKHVSGIDAESGRADWAKSKGKAQRTTSTHEGTTTTHQGTTSTHEGTTTIHQGITSSAQAKKKVDKEKVDKEKAAKEKEAKAKADEAKAKAAKEKEAKEKADATKAKAKADAAKAKAKADAAKEKADAAKAKAKADASKEKEAKAKADAAKAKSDADKAKADVPKAKSDADKANADVPKAKADAPKAKVDSKGAAAAKAKAKGVEAVAKAEADALAKAKAKADDEAAKEKDGEGKDQGKGKGKTVKRKGEDLPGERRLTRARTNQGTTSDNRGSTTEDKGTTSANQ